MAGPQYTHCVQPDDYKELDVAPHLAFAALATLLGGGAGAVAALPAVMWLLQDLCDYLMGGKHVCLGGDICAIGRVAEIEPVGHGKPFPENIDNDYSINLLLAPHGLLQFKGGTDKDNWIQVRDDGKQGDFIAEQQDMPEPREAKETWGRYAPYFTEFKSPDFGDPVVYPTSADKPFNVPVLHCEVEGSRIRDVCAVLDFLSSGGIPGLCDLEIGPFKIGRVICSIVAALFAPAILAALTIAWAAAEGGDPDTALDPGSGTIGLGDCLVVHGRWIYDAGHGGYNEIHAVKRIQKTQSDCSGWLDFQDMYDRWCGLTSEVPPPGEPGQEPAGMTPPQRGVYTAQLEPENRWIYHPLLDGCEEEEDPPPVPH